MKLSIVSTLYHSAEHLKEFCERTIAIAEQVAGDNYELILVNDGSPDNSLDIAIKLTETNSQVTVIDLSRNFGHHKAMMSGLAHSNGELIFLIDSDLEEEPEWLPHFITQLQVIKCDVVYGVQDTRKGGLFERMSGEWFYRILNFISGLDFPKNTVTARLMTRRYVNALLLHQEREIFILGLWFLTGFDQRPQLIKKKSLSKTNYTLSKKISLAINAITSFSNAPLIWIFNIGAFISFFSLGYVIYLISRWLFYTKSIMGWTSVMASIWLAGGLIICFIGIVGIYLSKMFTEIKQRPYTIVRKIYHGNKIVDH